MKKTPINIKMACMALLLSVSLHTQAQFGDDQPPTDGPPGCCDENPDVPLDGGLSILLAAGLGYGVKKARDLRKQNIQLQKTDG